METVYYYFFRDSCRDSVTAQIVGIYLNLNKRGRKKILQETLNLLTCANSRTDARIQKKVSHVTGYVSPVTNTITKATDLPPANYPTIHNRLICKDRHSCLWEPTYIPETPQKLKTRKIVQTFKN